MTLQSGLERNIFKVGTAHYVGVERLGTVSKSKQHTAQPDLRGKRAGNVHKGICRPGLAGWTKHFSILLSYRALVREASQMG